MQKILLFGTGDIARRIAPALEKNKKYIDFKILGFIDNDPTKVGKSFSGYKIYHPGSIYNFQYDKIVICCTDEREKTIKNQLLYGYKIREAKIENANFLLKTIMRSKYSHVVEAEIQNILKYWEHHELSIFNNYIEPQKDTYDEVRWDKKNNLPYILFTTIEGNQKNMYFPRTMNFPVIENSQVVKNLMQEQSIDSPHLYTTDNIYVDNGDVIVDAGVCEGNFSLKYINIASKLYLFECDPYWKEALWYTFKDYSNKVVLCDKFLTSRDGIKTVKLDSFIKENIDFLKIDIEGAELEALRGAKETLLRSNVKCSICSYHKKDDEKNIKDIMQSYGYETSNSKGYMVFLCDEDIFYHADFRHGIVYAKK